MSSRLDVIRRPASTVASRARTPARGGSVAAAPSTHRRRAARAGAATAVLGEVAAALRVGASPALAWQRVGVRTAPDGVPMVESVEAVTGLAAQHARAVVAACRLAAELGAPQAVLLEQVTLAVVRDAEAHDRRSAALAGPRTTARLLGWMPAGGLGVGVLLGADPLGLLLRPGPGTGLLAVGTALALAGHRWIRREVDAAVRAGQDE